MYPCHQLGSLDLTTIYALAFDIAVEGSSDDECEHYDCCCYVIESATVQDVYLEAVAREVAAAIRCQRRHRAAGHEEMLPGQTFDRYWRAKGSLHWWTCESWSLSRDRDFDGLEDAVFRVLTAFGAADHNLWTANLATTYEGDRVENVTFTGNPALPALLTLMVDLSGSGIVKFVRKAESHGQAGAVA